MFKIFPSCMANLHFDFNFSNYPFPKTQQLLFYSPNINTYFLLLLLMMMFCILLFAVITDDGRPTLEHRTMVCNMTIRHMGKPTANQNIWKLIHINHPCHSLMLVFVTPILTLGIIIKHWIMQMRDLIIPTENLT